MDLLDRPRRLIVNADDFGLSSSVNAAVIRAHGEGILTTASLMVNEPGFEEAVALAKEHPKLGVGLHLSLVCGRSALPPEALPNLVDDCGRFSDQPVRAGVGYFWNRSLRQALTEEIRAQVRAFRATGLVMDHVNGHLHLHLHPVIFSILVEHAREWGVRAMRCTRDRFWLNVRLARGRWGYRVTHALIFNWLSRRARPTLDQLGIKHTATVLGLLQNGRVDEAYVRALLTRLPGGDSELYSHPSLDSFLFELNALISPAVRDSVARNGIRLIRYQDL